MVNRFIVVAVVSSLLMETGFDCELTSNLVRQSVLFELLYGPEPSTCLHW
jgi:hypothetical protein